jgi:uncharacterized OB-fold protein
MTAYPQPREDVTNAPLIEAWRMGKLMLPRCKDCGTVHFYPKPVCPSCWSDRFEWFEAKGTGKIVAWSLVWKPHHDAFNGEEPIVLVEVGLPEGPTMLSRIVGENRQSAKTGAAVKLVPMPEAARYPLPTFVLA